MIIPGIFLVIPDQNKELNVFCWIKTWIHSIRDSYGQECPVIGRNLSEIFIYDYSWHIHGYRKIWYTQILPDEPPNVHACLLLSWQVKSHSALPTHPSLSLWWHKFIVRRQKISKGHSVTVRVSRPLVFCKEKMPRKMKAASLPIEGGFDASRRRLHQPSKAASWKRQDFRSKSAIINQ